MREPCVVPIVLAWSCVCRQMEESSGLASANGAFARTVRHSSRTGALDVN